MAALGGMAVVGCAGRRVAAACDGFAHGSVAGSLFPVLFLSGLLAAACAVCTAARRAVGLGSGGGAVGAVSVVSVAASSDYAFATAGFRIRLSSLAAGMQPCGAAASDTGSHGVWTAGVVCHGIVVAVAAPRSRVTAVGVAEGMLTAVLRSVCAAYVLSAVVLLLFAYAGLVLRDRGRGVAAAVVRAGIDDGCKHTRHMAAVEDPHRPFLDRLMAVAG